MSILGLQPGASEQDIRQVYRDLAQVWHPDRFAHNARLRAKAETRLKEINEAYQILSVAPLLPLEPEQQRATNAQPPPARQDAPTPSSASSAPTAARSWGWIIITLFSFVLARSCSTAYHHAAPVEASVPQINYPIITPLTLQPRLGSKLATRSDVNPMPTAVLPAVQAQNVIGLAAASSPTPVPSGVSDYADNQKRLDREQAAYWKERGYTFDPTYMTAYLMDQKVTDIKRAEYWKERGYMFDPTYMTAYLMDQKVTDIKRAEYWKEQGYTFDPTYITAYSMDQKVTDIKRAEYWKERGYTFDPTYMTAYLMDAEVEKQSKRDNP